MCYARESMASKPPPIVSTLNPNAPVFVPAAFLAAEDFSTEWWHLIQTNNSFKEWWMKERYEAEENEQAAAVAARRDENDFDIDELIELGFQPGILDDFEDQPSPVASPRSSHFEQRQPYYQQQPHLLPTQQPQLRQVQQPQLRQVQQPQLRQVQQPQLRQGQQPQLRQGQQPQQQEHAQQLQNEYTNLLIPPSHSFQKFRSVDGAAGGAQYYRGTVLHEGRSP